MDMPTRRNRRSNDQTRAIGKRLRELRILSGIQLWKLAEVIGVSYQQLQKYEVGINRLPVDKMVIAAEAMGVSISEFLTEDVGIEQIGHDSRRMIKVAPMLQKLSETDYTMVLDMLRRLTCPQDPR